MELTGEERIGASAARVWEALSDLAVLARVIPGCEALARRDDGTGFEATLVQMIGPVQARLDGRIDLIDVKSPESCTLRGEGRGGTGFVSGEAKIRLEPQGDGATKLIYVVRADIGGELARFGQPLIDRTARSLADEFFARFLAAVTGLPAEPARSDLTPAIWVPAFIALTLVLVAAFAML